MTATLGSNNLGRNLVLTVGVVTSTNALKLTGVTGQDFNTSELVQYVSSGGSTETLAAITPTSVTINSDEFDGKHIRVTHPYHGMHAFNNKVELTRIEGDSIPTNITVGYGASSIENISIASSANFNMFEVFRPRETRVQGSKGPRVQRSKGPKVQRSKGPRVQGSNGPRVQWSKYLTKKNKTIQTKSKG